MKNYFQSYIFVFILMLSLPLILFVVGFGRKGELNGLVIATKIPEISLNSVRDGTYQRDAEAWILERFPWRKLIVQTENSLNYTLFKETLIPKGGTAIVRGKDGYIFEKSHINKLNDVSDLKQDLPLKAIDAKKDLIQRLGLAAKIFRNRRINFVFLFYPTKASILPEFIESKWLLPMARRESARLGYQQLLTALKDEGVPVLDSVQIFSNLKLQRPDILLFNKGGTHWAHQGACFVIQEMIKLLESQNLRHFPQVDCVVEKMIDASGVYQDIASLLNLLDISDFSEQVPSISLNYSKSELKKPFETLMVKTSFSGQILSILEDSKYANTKKFFHYYRHSDQSSVNWDEDVFRKEWIIFEQTEWSYITINIEDFLTDLESNSKIYMSELKKLEAEK